jgi:enoyl-CoA hydratase/carnithine racemase
MCAVRADDPTSDQGTTLVKLDRTTVDGVTIATLTLNRPDALNPIDYATISAIDELLTVVEADAEARAIIFTGEGRAFSAGGDLKAYQTLFRNPAMFESFMTTFAHVCDRLEASRLITVAMINGTCVAGGLELALACDFVTIADDAMIGDGHLRFSQLPGAGGSQRLARSIGLHRARHWLLTGALFPAEAAVTAGLAVGSSGPGSLRDFTVQLVLGACRASPLATAQMKHLINVAENTPLAEGLEQERRVVGTYATTSHDATEGLEAFAQHRPPNYTGR